MRLVSFLTGRCRSAWHLTAQGQLRCVCFRGYCIDPTERIAHNARPRSVMHDLHQPCMAHASNAVRGNMKPFTNINQSQIYRLTICMVGMVTWHICMTRICTIYITWYLPCINACTFITPSLVWMSSTSAAHTWNLSNQLTMIACARVIACALNGSLRTWCMTGVPWPDSAMTKRCHVSHFCMCHTSACVAQITPFTSSFCLWSSGPS